MVGCLHRGLCSPRGHGPLKPDPTQDAGSLLSAGRPFGARRLIAKPEIGRSDSSPRVRFARSATCEEAMSVYVATAGDRNQVLLAAGAEEYEWRPISRRAACPP